VFLVVALHTLSAPKFCMHYVSPPPTMGLQHTVVYEIKQ